MGIFSSTKCCICGNKATGENKVKLAERLLLCADCRKKCSPDLNPPLYAELTSKQILDDMRVYAENRAEYADIFKPDTIIKPSHAICNDVLRVDMQNCLWSSGASDEPEVFTFEQIKNYKLKLYTRDVRQDQNYPTVPASRPDFPTCPSKSQITAMSIEVEVDHPYLKYVTLWPMDVFIPEVTDVISGYAISDEVYGIFESMMSGGKEALHTRTWDEEFGEAAETLKKLKELMDTGIITQEEFNEKKRQLLNM